MSTTSTDVPSTAGSYRKVVILMALLLIFTVGRIVVQLFTSAPMAILGTVVATLSIMLVCYVVVSVAPYRRQLDARFGWVVGVGMACNVISNIVWLIS